MNRNVFIPFMQTEASFISQLDRRHLRQDVVSGLCLSNNNIELVEDPSEIEEIEDNYDYGMEEWINHGPYFESNEESHY